MVLGRKTEAIDFLERFTERGEKDENRAPVGGVGTFNRPTDVTWDSDGNIFVADGYNNSRVAKLTKDGRWVKALGTRGAGPNQFNTVHAIAADAKNNIYVADRGNRRIQVFDPDLNPVKIISNVGAPWSLCVSPAAGSSTAVSVQRRRERQTLQAGHERQSGRVGADGPGARPERLPGSRAPLRVGERDLQGRLLDLDGGENHHQGDDGRFGELRKAQGSKAQGSRCLEL